jgi:hypothetical protein
MQISAKVLRVLEAEKISADELYRMLDDVAFTSIRGCNRRYFQWLFVVKDNRLEDMQQLDLVEIGRGSTRMLEEHDDCEGEGCKACGWAGQVSRAIEDTTARALNLSV